MSRATFALHYIKRNSVKRKRSALSGKNGWIWVFPSLKSPSPSSARELGRRIDNGRTSILSIPGLHTREGSSHLRPSRWCRRELRRRHVYDFRTNPWKLQWFVNRVGSFADDLPSRQNHTFQAITFWSESGHFSVTGPSRVVISKWYSSTRPSRFIFLQRSRKIRWPSSGKNVVSLTCKTAFIEGHHPK